MPNTALDPTQRLSAVQRALYLHLAGLSLPGSPVLVFEGLQRPAGAVPWVYVVVSPLPGERAGRAANGTQGATHDRALLSLSLHWPDGSLAPVGNVYTISDAASALQQRLSPPLALPLQDWTDPSNPTGTGIDLFPLGLAESLPLPDSGGFRMALVQQTFEYFPRVNLS